MINLDIEKLKFDEKGLIPAIVIDSITKKVLTQIVDVLYLEDDENDSFEKFLLSFDIIDEKIILNKRISDIAPKTLSYYEGYAFRRNICTQSMLRIKIISIVCRCFG